MIYAIDFDGTIVENKFPAIGELKPEAASFISALKERGDKWILYTMREGPVLDEALAFLRDNGLEPDAVNDNLPEMCEFYHNNPRKVFANVYIDDHNAGGLLFSRTPEKGSEKGDIPGDAQKDLFEFFRNREFLAERLRDFHRQYFQVEREIMKLTKKYHLCRRCGAEMERRPEQDGSGFKVWRCTMPDCKGIDLESMPGMMKHVEKEGKVL